MRVNLTVPEELYEEIEGARKGRYLSTQEFILEAIRKEIAARKKHLEREEVSQ